MLKFFLRKLIIRGSSERKFVAFGESHEHNGRGDYLPKAETSAARPSILGIGQHPAPPQDQHHCCVFGCRDRTTSSCTFRAKHALGWFPNSTSSYAGFRRHSWGLRIGAKSLMARIPVRSACGKADPHLFPASRIPRWRDRGADAVGRRGPGKLCFAQCIFSSARFGEKNANRGT